MLLAISNEATIGYLNYLSTKLDPYEEFQNTMKTTRTQRIHVSHLQEDFTSDVFAFYKNPNADLRAQVKVVFEEELAVGEGPRREYFSILMKLISCRFNIRGGSNKVTQVFEDEMDHKDPIADALLAQAGFYRTVGKMLGHVYHHGGPLLYGLSPAIVHWLSYENLDENPPPLVVRDIPDFELRTLLEQVYSTSLSCIGASVGIAGKNNSYEKEYPCDHQTANRTKRAETWNG